MLTFLGVFNRFWGDLIIIKLVLEKFIESLFTLITKATRITYHSKTLIDHIYTNAPEKVIKSGICLAEFVCHL